MSTIRPPPLRVSHPHPPPSYTPLLAAHFHLPAVCTHSHQLPTTSSFLNSDCQSCPSNNSCRIESASSYTVRKASDIGHLNIHLIFDLIIALRVEPIHRRLPIRGRDQSDHPPHSRLPTAYQGRTGAKLPKKPPFPQSSRSQPFASLCSFPPLFLFLPPPFVFILQLFLQSLL